MAVDEAVEAVLTHLTETGWVEPRLSPARPQARTATPTLCDLGPTSTGPVPGLAALEASNCADIGAGLCH
jgi:hypothetical protein